MPHIPGLRSPYRRVGRMVYFGRMLDKIRLHAAGKLPPSHVANLGETRPNLFDARCCRFLGIVYNELAARTREGGSDREILAWAESRGLKRSDEDCLVWNRYMMKIGWRDDSHEGMRQRVIENGLTQHTIETSFDMIDYDEGRDPVRTRPWELRPPMVVILMGVAGSGKTTVGRSLADALGWTFRDADSFHPPANIAKMSSGVPLNDTDRRPWLQAIRAFISAALEQDESAVVTCSALKQSYREIFIAPPPGVIEWVYLKGSRELLARRLAKRNGHFMKAEMLDSQLATLEEPKEALTVDVAESPATLVTEIRRALAL